MSERQDDGTERVTRDGLDTIPELGRLREEERDSRHLRWALIAAFGLHAVLLLVDFPEWSSVHAAAEAPEKRVYVVEPMRYRPPPPPEVPEIVPRRATILVPDPTPDDPEPIPRSESEVQILPEVDILGLDIPPAPPVPEPQGPLEVVGDVRKPEAIRTPQPHYTEAARLARQEGVVILEATIDRQGEVIDVRVLKGLPFGLSEAAVAAVRRWQYRPATLDGRPVAVYFRLTVRFELR